MELAGKTLPSKWHAWLKLRGESKMQKSLLDGRRGGKLEAAVSLDNENGFVFITGEKEEGKTLDFLQTF